MRAIPRDQPDLFLQPDAAERARLAALRAKCVPLLSELLLARLEAEVALVGEEAGDE